MLIARFCVFFTVPMLLRVFEARTLLVDNFGPSIKSADIGLILALQADYSKGAELQIR